MDQQTGRQSSGIQPSSPNKRNFLNEDSLRYLWNNTKHTNIRIIGVPEGEEREKGPEEIFEEIRV